MSILCGNFFIQERFVYLRPHFALAQNVEFCGQLNKLNWIFKRLYQSQTLLFHEKVSFYRKACLKTTKNSRNSQKNTNIFHINSIRLTQFFSIFQWKYFNLQLKGISQNEVIQLKNLINLFYLSTQIPCCVA